MGEKMRRKPKKEIADGVYEQIVTHDGQIEGVNGMRAITLESGKEYIIPANDELRTIQISNGAGLFSLQFEDSDAIHRIRLGPGQLVLVDPGQEQDVKNIRKENLVLLVTGITNK